MINSIYPNSFDFKLANEKGFVTDKKLNERYFKVQYIYRYVFEEYICKRLDLKKYDDKIKESSLSFNKCSKERMDYYQRTSTLNLDYIYVKNNFHIEKLSNDDIKVIEENKNKNSISEIVKKTYKEVITINMLNGKQINGSFETQYFEGFNNIDTVFGNDSLILIIREGKPNSGLSGEELRKNLKEKYEFINNLIEEMNTEFKDKLLCEIEIGHLFH